MGKSNRDLAVHERPMEFLEKKVRQIMKETKGPVYAKEVFKCEDEERNQFFDFLFWIDRAYNKEKYTRMLLLLTKCPKFAQVLFWEVPKIIDFDPELKLKGQKFITNCVLNLKKNEYSTVRTRNASDATNHFIFLDELKSVKPYLGVPLYSNEEALNRLNIFMGESLALLTKLDLSETVITGSMITASCFAHFKDIKKDLENYPSYLFPSDQNSFAGTDIDIAVLGLQYDQIAQQHLRCIISLFKNVNIQTFERKVKHDGKEETQIMYTITDPKIFVSANSNLSFLLFKNFNPSYSFCTWILSRKWRK